MVRATFHETTLWHEKKEITTQEQIAASKRRIEELKRKNTTLYIGQPEAKQTDEQCYNEIADACKELIRTGDDKSEQILAQTLEKHNLRLYCYPSDKVSDFTKAQSAIARMTFNGCLPPTDCLYACADIVKGIPENKGKINQADYNFNGTLWEVFKKFPEFAELEDKLRDGLAKKGISSQLLPELKLHDFCYILAEQLQKQNLNEKSISFMEESYKARHTKRFIKENEEEFRAGLLAMPGIRKDYVEALIYAMKEGRTDLTKPINGKRLWKEEWKDQPVINVHHIVNVKDARVIDDWTKVNSYENMCFIVTHPQHDAMHAFEQDLQGNYRNDIFHNPKINKSMIYRIQPPEGVRCMLGFHNMIYDKKYVELPEDEKTIIKEKAENDKHRVSGSHGRNIWHGHPKNDPYAQRKDWKREKLDYVRH